MKNLKNDSHFPKIEFIYSEMMGEGDDLWDDIKGVANDLEKGIRDGVEGGISITKELVFGKDQLPPFPEKLKKNYDKIKNPKMKMEDCTTIAFFREAPSGYEIVKPKEGSFAHFLQNYPIGKGSLEYEPKTKKMLHDIMPDPFAKNSVIKEVTEKLVGVWNNGDWSKDRVSDMVLDNGKTFGNVFSNDELASMVAGYHMGAEIRDVNWHKQTFTDGKLNMEVIDKQDCICACVRLREEYRALHGLLTSSGIRKNMSTERSHRKLTRYFQRINTINFSANHNNVCDKLTDEQIEKRKLELEIGDYISFNKKPGRGGHTVIVMAKAKNEEGESVYRIATSTLPATDMALYKGWIKKEDFLGGGTMSILISQSLLGKATSILPDFITEGGLKSEDKYTVSIGRYIDSQRGRGKKKRR